MKFRALSASKTMEGSVDGFVKARNRDVPPLFIGYWNPWDEERAGEYPGLAPECAELRTKLRISRGAEWPHEGSEVWSGGALEFRSSSTDALLASPCFEPAISRTLVRPPCQESLTRITSLCPARHRDDFTWRMGMSCSIQGGLPFVSSETRLH